MTTASQRCRSFNVSITSSEKDHARWHMWYFKQSSQPSLLVVCGQFETQGHKNWKRHEWTCNDCCRRLVHCQWRVKSTWQVSEPLSRKQELKHTSGLFLKMFTTVFKIMLFLHKLSPTFLDIIPHINFFLWPVFCRRSGGNSVEILALPVPAFAENLDTTARSCVIALGFNH